MAEYECEAHKQDSDSNSVSVRSRQQSKGLDDEPSSINPLKEIEVNVETEAAAVQELRRSQRTRKFTEKGQELHNGKSKRLQHCFASAYDRWKALAKQAKKALDEPSSTEILLDLRTKIRCASTDVKQTYEDLRQHNAPDGETRRRADTCDAVSRRLLDYAWNHLEEKDD